MNPVSIFLYFFPNRVGSVSRFDSDVKIQRTDVAKGHGYQKNWRNLVCFISLISFSFFFFNWVIIALQCCISFCFTAKWISYMYTYIPSFLHFLPIYVTTDHLVEFPVLYSRFSLVIYFIHSINPNLPIHPIPLPSLVSICLFSMSVCLFLLCK